jgi:phosphate transport system permease protein
MSTTNPTTPHDAINGVATSTREEQERIRSRIALGRRLHAGNRVASAVLWGIGTLVALIFISILVYVVFNGLPAMVDPKFFGNTDAGIGRELYNTLYILILSELFLFPISLADAIYLIEYAPQGRFVTAIHFAAETLAGVPSLVLGMFGFLVFVVYLHMGVSRLAGALTLLCLNFPLALRLFEEALVSVPRELREGGLALGGTKWHVIRTVVLPSALPGLITGLILTAGKVIGEAAALIFTMGLVSPFNPYTLSPSLASDTLTTRLYYLRTDGLGSSGLPLSKETALAAGIAGILIVLLLLINISARAIGRVIQRRVTAA